MATPRLSDDVKLERALQRARDENTRLRAVNKKLVRLDNGYELFLDELKEILAEDVFSYDTAELPQVDPSSIFDPDTTEIAAAALSDIHLSEVVSPHDSNGINAYNSIIAANRLWEYVGKLKSLITRHRHTHTIEKIWSPLLGDIISGTIHSEQLLTNDLTDEAAVVLATRLLYMFYKELATLGLPIHIDAVHGNHPRTTTKMPTKKQAHTNRDWVIYEMLKDRLEGDEQIAIDICTAQIGQRKLYKWNYLFEHGIAVGNGSEEAFEDRVRALFDDPVFREATGFKGSSFDQVVIGNMHKPKFLERTIVNGSVTGQNELGQSWRLKPIKAQQLLWGISKKHVRTWQYQIDLTHIKSSAASNPMSDYAKWFLKRHGARGSYGL